jgi:hypothetical protein
VLEAVQSDPAIRNKYDGFLLTRRLLSEAFSGVLAEPVPDRLQRAILDHGRADGAAGSRPA